MHLTTFSQIISKKDSVKCLTNEQIKIINNVFLDLDECEQEVLALGKIVTIQDTMLKSKIDLLAIYKKQDEYNEELKYQLREVEKFFSWYNKIKTMNELDSQNYWKRTNNHIYKIKERLINIAKTIKEIEK